MKDKPSIFEWIVFFLFILLEISIFSMRILGMNSETTQIETILYGTFEIIFSLYIGYFVQRLDSARQFQESLKRYGLSAYRRIMDISKSIDRTINQIEKIRKNYPVEKTSDLDVLRSILEGTFDTVRSSISDWGEIIGEEIRKTERAYQLEGELKNLEKEKKDEKTNTYVENLKVELDSIRSQLLLPTSEIALSGTLEKQGFYSTYFEATGKRDGFIPLYIKPAFDYSSINVKDVFEKQPFSFILSDNLNDTVECYVSNNEGFFLGNIQNPMGFFDDTPYIKTLRRILIHMKLDSSGKEVSEDEIYEYKLSNLEFIEISNDGLIKFHLLLPNGGAGFAPWG